MNEIEWSFQDVKWLKKAELRNENKMRIRMNYDLKQWKIDDDKDFSGNWNFTFQWNIIFWKDKWLIWIDRSIRIYLSNSSMKNDSDI